MEQQPIMKPAFIASGPGVFSLQYVIAIGDQPNVLAECRIDTNDDVPKRTYLVNGEEVASCFQAQNDPEAAAGKKKFSDFPAPVHAALETLSGARSAFQRIFWLQNPAQPVAVLKTEEPTSIQVKPLTNDNGITEDEIAADASDE